MKNVGPGLTAALALCAATASADILVNENFDIMGVGPGTATLPSGWTAGFLGAVGSQNRLAMSPYAGNGQAITTMPIYAIAAVGVDYRTSYNGGTFTDVGHLYNAGVAGANPVTDRALGSYPRTNPSGDHIMQVAFNNTAGGPISSIHLEYDMEQWGWGQGASSSGPEVLRVLFSSTSAIDGFQYLGTGFDGVAPHQGPGSPVDLVIDGNAAGNFVHVSGDYTLPSTLQAGDAMWLRFHDWNENSTTDHLLAIDNVLLTATVVPEPASWSLLAVGALALIARRRKA